MPVGPAGLSPYHVAWHASDARAGSLYAGHRFLHMLVHGWDLAVATGEDYALDPKLIRAGAAAAAAEAASSAGRGSCETAWQAKGAGAR